MPSLRDVFVKLGIRGDPKGAKVVTQQIDGMKKAAKTAIAALAGFATVQAFRTLINDTAALGDSIDKVSSKLGINAQALQELRFAAGQTGVAQRNLDMGLQRFTRRVSEAAIGTGEAKDALAEMGIQLTDTQGNVRPTEDLLGDVADVMQRTTNDADRVRLAFKLFDSEGVSLVNTLKGGRDALEALRKKARDTGGIFDDELIKQSVDYRDQLHEMSLALQGVRNLIAKQLFPALIRASRGFTEWLKVNRAIIRERFDAVFKRIGQVISGVTSFVLRLADAFGPVGRQILKLTGIALGLAVTLMLPGAPILLLIGLLALLIEDFEAWRRGADSVIGDIVYFFGELTDAVTKHTNRFAQWVKDHETGLTYVGSLIVALVAIIGSKLVAANAAAGVSFLALKAKAVGAFIAMQAAAIAAGVKAGVAWLIAAAPITLMAALLAVVVGTLIFIGVELVKLAAGHANFFTTMAKGIADLVDRFGGIAPAITEMLREAAVSLASFFTHTRADAEEWVGNVQMTLTHLWDSVLEFWSEKLGGWWDKWSNVIDFGFGGGDEGERPGVGGATSPTPESVAPPRIARAINRTATSTVVDNSTRNVSLSVVTQPGQSNQAIADMVVSRIRSEDADRLRAAQQSFAVGAP